MTQPIHRNLAGVVLCLALAGCGGSNEPDGGSPGDGGPPRGNSPPAEVGYVEITPEPIDRAGTSPGRVVAHEVAEIRPQVGGIIEARQFEEGARVEEGDPLYQIDPDRYEADHQMARANLRDAEARRENAQRLENRFERLLPDGSVSQQQYDDALAELNRAKAAVALAEAEVKAARIDLDDTTVRSPISGYIGPSSVTRGALVTALQAESLATVRQLDPVYVDLELSADESRDLRKRLTASVSGDGGRSEFKVTLYPGNADAPYPHEGALDAAELAVDTRTGSMRVRTVFPNPELTLLPGMFVRASIRAGAPAQAITVPQKSVTIRPDGTKTVWLIDSEDTARRRAIQTGGTHRNSWIVSDGLEAGDRVVVEGAMGLREGAAVRPGEIDR